jgi:signal transduction histidine kinase
VLLLTWVVILAQPTSLSNPLLYAGIALVCLITAVALLFTWNESNRRWAVVLPVVDIVAIVLIRAGEPSLGSGLFLAFPVLWLARNFGLNGAVGGAALSTTLLWTQRLLSGEPLGITDIAALVLLPVTLCFIATTSYVAGLRTRGQRRLLREQANIIEVAFDRARSQELSLDEILNAVSFGVIAFDRHGRVTLTNDAHRRSLSEFGAPRSAIVHPVIYQADRVTPYPPESRPFARALRGQSFDNITYWAGEPGSRQAAYSASSRHLTTAQGEPDGGVLVLRDVTAELEAIKARDSLIGSVSHELRTPLTAILGYLELALDDDRLDDETRRMIDISYRNSERLLVLVTDLLLAASQADKTLPVKPTPTDISDIVEQAVEGQQYAADERSLTLVTEIEPGIIASADPVRIRQVLDNLLSNAVKYNRQGGSIRVSAHAAASTVTVAVSDTGNGISEADLAQLFDRFFRTESARKSAEVGSGLGLSITRDIARQHGGDLTVESSVGVGTTFTMTIPRESAPLPDTEERISTP